MADAVVVQVLDSRDRPAVGQRVAFVTADGSASPDTVTTDGDGRAEASWVLGGSAGAQTLEARVVGAASVKATFTAQAAAAGAAKIEAFSGQNQVGVVGMPLDQPYVVRVTDEFDNPVAGVQVSWTAVGAGSVTPAQSTTGTNGRAQARSTLGTTPGGVYVTHAAAAGLDGSPASFSSIAGSSGGVSASHSSVTVDPATIVASDGSAKTTITVVARDDFDNPLSDVAVTVTASGTGNTLTPNSTTTNEAGQYKVTLSSTVAESKTIHATIGSVVLSQTPTVTVKAGPASAAHSAATVPDGRVGEETRIVIRVKDAFDNPVTSGNPDVRVDVSGANKDDHLDVQDQGDGTFVARYTPTKAGDDHVRIRVGGDDIPGSTFTSVVKPGAAAAANTTATVESSAFGGRSTVTITTRDAFDNPLTTGSANILVTITNGSGSVPLTSFTDNEDGTYTAVYQRNFLTADSIAITLDGTAIKGSPYSD